ncbi:Methyltransferase domain protein [uncultured archaeon]|nr:Methyltransferase domain protein [uncultured archaeon]
MPSYKPKFTPGLRDEKMKERRRIRGPMIKKMLLDWKVLPLTGRLLEVGAGYGAFNTIVKTSATQFDIDEEALRVNPAPDKVCGDIMHLDAYFRKEAFDAAIAYSCLYDFNKPDLEKALRKISDVLMLGGRLIVVNDHLPDLEPFVWDLAQEGLYALPVFDPGRLGSVSESVKRYFCIEYPELERAMINLNIDPTGVLRKLVNHCGDRPLSEEMHFEHARLIYDLTGMPEALITLFAVKTAYEMHAGRELQFVDPYAFFSERLKTCCEAAGLKMVREKLEPIVYESNEGKVTTKIYASIIEKAGTSV